jgi:hypothetical protein
MSAVEQVDSPRRARVAGFAARHRQVLLLALLSVIATLPVWIPPYPPMADLPQHAAQVGLWRSLGDPAFHFASLFQLNWFTPYLVGYLLMYVLAPLLGTVLACKAVVALALAAVPLATSLLLKEMEADIEWAPLTVLALYGFSYHWGLFNFIVATPIGLVFLWLVMRHLRAPRWTTAFELALMAIALFFCHALICAFFCVVVGFFALFALRGIGRAVARLAPLAVVVPVAFFWSRTAANNPLAKEPILWDLNWFTTPEPYYLRLGTIVPDSLGWGRLTGLIPRMLGVPSTLPFIALGVLVLALPLLAGARPARRAAAFVPLAVCLLALFLVPGVLFGNSYTYQRFTVFLLPFYLAVFGHPAGSWRGRLVRRAVPCVALLWTLSLSVQAMAFRAESSDFQPVLAAMEPGQRTLGFAFEWQSASRTAIAPAFLHFTSWYTAERRGVTDPSFAVSYAPMVQYREAARPRAGILGFEWNPRMFDWWYFNGAGYRYFLARAFEDPGPFLRRTAPCPLHLAAHSGAWWLYERDPSCLR